MSEQRILFSLVLFWDTASEQRAPTTGKPGWVPEQKEGGSAAGGRGRCGEADPGCPRTLLSCLNPELRFSKVLSPPKLSKLLRTWKPNAYTCPDPQALARARAALAFALRTRERAAPEAGHAVAGISPASGFLWRAPSSSSPVSDPAIFPSALPPRTPRCGGGRRRGCVHHPDPLQETSLRCVRASEPTAARRERGRRWKSWRLRCLGSGGF